MCQICAGIHHSDKKRIMWDRSIVCPECWNPRESQDFVRGVADKQSVPNPNPEPEDTFLAYGEVTADDL